MDKGTKKRTRRADGYSIVRRADGRWEARVTVGYNENGNPKRRSFYGKTRTDVLDLAKAYKLKLDGGGFAPVTRDSSVGQWLDRWLETYIRHNREPKTYDYYEAYIRLHLRPALGSLPLRKLTAQHVQELMNEKSSAGLSPNFVRGLQATLRSALSQAWREGLIESNVATRVTPPKIRQSEPVYLTPEEARAFVESLRGHRLENLFSFAIATGVRIGEISGIRWADVDFEKRCVMISRQLQRIDGKLVLKDLKSRSSRRVLALGETSFRALQQERATHMLEGVENPLGLAFLNAEGRPLDPKYVHSHLKAHLKAAGLKEVSFHKLRHTAATLMVAAGVDLHQVKEQLGHGQISLTANLYSHGVPEAQRRAADALDGVIRRGTLQEGT